MARRTRSATMKAMPRYLVTGCAGFIGSWITQTLVERGATVRGLDNFETGNRDNIAHLQGRFDFVECDLRDADATARACEGIDFIFHQASPALRPALREGSPHQPHREPRRHLQPARRRARGRRQADHLRRVVFRLRQSARISASSKPWCPCRSRRTRCRSWPASST